jgi:DNA-binding HxlR family transcriptional regulator
LHAKLPLRIDTLTLYFSIVFGLSFHSQDELAMTRRSYRQYCGLARTLDVVGERWTFLIVRNLLLGPRRYGELQARLPGITSNLLAQRLNEMQDAGLVERVEHAGISRWALTALGLALEPALMELGRWGGRLMGKPQRGDTLDIGWALIALKRRFHGRWSGRVLALRVHERGKTREFEISARGSYLNVLEHAVQRPDATVEGDVEAFRDLLLAGVDFKRLLRRGQLQVTGDDEIFHSWLAALDPVPASACAIPLAHCARDW